jgi:predicted cupin superfamily sugar epimerase
MRNGKEPDTQHYFIPEESIKQQFLFPSENVCIVATIDDEFNFKTFELDLNEDHGEQCR